MPGVARGVQNANIPVVWDVSVNNTDSQEVKLRGFIPTHIRMPNAFTGGNISFKAKDAAGDWVVVTDDAGTTISVAVAADRVVDLPSDQLAGLDSILLVSDLAEAADRTAVLACML